MMVRIFLLLIVPQMLYFAYGSNMFNRRLQLRVPSAKPVSKALLTGYEIQFHKKSNADGSAKCSILENEGSEVYGIVFEIDSDEKKLLDRVEGVGTGYEIKQLKINLPSKTIKAFAYVATESHIDDSLRPFRWYKRLVLAGAEQHQLPEFYINRIRKIEAVEDPDEKRRQEAEDILSHYSENSMEK